MSNLLPTTLASDEDPNIEIQRRQNRRTRYLEKLGEHPTIDLQRVTPGNNPVWNEIGLLRRDVYVNEHEYLSPDVLDSNGREYDDYDSKADTIHIAATNSSNEVVGYVRILTKGSDGEGLLPAEKAFSTQLDGDTVEISRLISKREFPGAPLVTLALIRAAMHELNSDPEKYGMAVATLEPFLAIHLDNMGIPIETLIDMQDTPEYNSSNMLVAMDHHGIVDRATEVDPQRKFSPVYPERLGPWFAAMEAERGLGRIALVDIDEK